MRYAPDTKPRNEVRRQCQGRSEPKMVCNTPQYQEESTHQIWDSYLKYFWRYAPDTISLETLS